MGNSSGKAEAMATTLSSKPYNVVSGLGAGAGAALAMMAVMGLLRYSFNVPTIPELMLSTLLNLLGGQSFSDALDKLFYAGRPLLFAAILEGILLVGALLGLLYAWLARPDAATGRRMLLLNSPFGGILYGLVIGLLLNTLFLQIVGLPIFTSSTFGPSASSGSSTFPLWFGLMLLALFYGVTLDWLLPLRRVSISAADTSDQIEEEEPVTANEGRRRFLRIAGSTALAVVGGLIFAGAGTVVNQGGFTNPVDRRAADDSIGAQGAGSSNPAGGAAAQVQSTPEPPRNTPISEPTQYQRNETPTQAPQPTGTSTPAPVSTEMPTTEAAQQATETPPPLPADTPPPPPSTGTAAPPLPVMRVQEITPTNSFYHVSKNFFDPAPSANGWQLVIKGNYVKKPYTLTYKELTALPAEVVIVGMMCISNPIGGGLAGNARWKGVKLADLLTKAGLKPGIVDISMTAVDGYTDSIPLQKAMDPDVVLVWEMNGAPLTAQHGFPARLLVPGIYGMKHVKWITSFEPVSYDFKGFWQSPQQGWSDPAIVNTMSRIDYPVDGILQLKKQSLSGVAFAGSRSISKVEVSVDGGRSWDQAYVKPPLSNTSWVLWGYDWAPTAAGQYTVKVRATDGKGNLQTAKVTDPYPYGATGYHTVKYMVKRTAAEVPTSQSSVALNENDPSPTSGRKIIWLPEGGRAK